MRAVGHGLHQLRQLLGVGDGSLVADEALKALGAKGVVRPATGSVQVVLGPEADLISDNIRAVLVGAGEHHGLDAQARRADAAVPLSAVDRLSCRGCFKSVDTSRASRYRRDAFTRLSLGSTVNLQCDRNDPK
ncbi:hypothetical protein [Archangium sp.]|uniref:hypothetical protein n=1 Tax=Archangium sp. TaxID=1872627 RepID=UPI002D28D82D|nr:hypothetical protein [Archangium sp.]HYO57108.1 hypothetical protein [Archangium sp.]